MVLFKSRCLFFLVFLLCGNAHGLEVIVHFWSGPCPDGVEIIPNGCRDGETIGLPGPVDLSDGVNTLREGFLIAAQNWQGVVDDDVTIEVAPYQFIPSPQVNSVAFNNSLIVRLEKPSFRFVQGGYRQVQDLLRHKSFADLFADARSGQALKDAFRNLVLTSALPRSNRINAIVDPDNSLPLTDDPDILLTLAQLRALPRRGRIDAFVQPRFSDEIPLPQIPDPATGKLRFIDGFIGFNVAESFDPNPNDGIGGKSFTPAQFQQAVIAFILGESEQPFPAGARQTPLQYDFVAAAAHEIGHVLAVVLTSRQDDPAILGDATDVADLFRFREETAATIKGKRDFREAERYWVLNPFGTPFETIDADGQVLHRFESYLECRDDAERGLVADERAIGCKERENNVHAYGLRRRNGALVEAVYNGEFGGAFHLKDDQPLIIDAEVDGLRRCAFGGDEACRYVAQVEERRSLMAVFATPYLTAKIQHPDLNVLNTLGWNINRAGLRKQNRDPVLENLTYFEDELAGTDSGVWMPISDVTGSARERQDAPDGDNVEATVWPWLIEEHRR